MRSGSHSVKQRCTQLEVKARQRTVCGICVTKRLQDESLLNETYADLQTDLQNG